MNRYGRIAMTHWQRWRPEAYRQLPNPEDFFSTLGDSLMEEIIDLADALEEPDRPGESYLEKVGRLNMDKLMAEEKILGERVYAIREFDEEPDQDSEDVSYLREGQGLCGGAAASNGTSACRRAVRFRRRASRTSNEPARHGAGRVRLSLSEGDLSRARRPRPPST